jgi:hypothetical protein
VSKVYDVVAIVGKRRDDKPNYVKCGAVFTTEKGMSMKLDSIPAGGEWNGWFSFFEPKPRSDSPPSNGPGSTTQFDENGIPF